LSVFRALRRHPVTDLDVVGGVALPDVVMVPCWWASRWYTRVLAAS